MFESFHRLSAPDVDSHSGKYDLSAAGCDGHGYKLQDLTSLTALHYCAFVQGHNGDRNNKA